MDDSRTSMAGKQGFQLSTLDKRKATPVAIVCDLSFWRCGAFLYDVTNPTQLTTWIIEILAYS